MSQEPVDQINTAETRKWLLIRRAKTIYASHTHGVFLLELLTSVNDGDIQHDLPADTGYGGLLVRHDDNYSALHNLKTARRIMKRLTTVPAVFDVSVAWHPCLRGSVNLFLFSIPGFRDGRWFSTTCLNLSHVRHLNSTVNTVIITTH